MSEFVRPCGLTEAQMIEAWVLHQQYEFADKSVDSTMETMYPEDSFITHVPTMAGGRGLEGIRQFYSTNFIPCNPPDTKVELVSRTIGDYQLVDELIFSFTHTQEVHWILPGVPPTGKYICVPLVVIVGFSHSKVNKEHIYWDQGSVLLQAGLIQKTPEHPLPVFGSETAEVVQHTREPTTY